MTIIVPGDQTGPEAPEVQDNQSTEIPAKFRNEDGSLNTDALLKSYQHLEQKLGQRSPEPPPAPEQPTPTEEAPKPEDGPKTNDDDYDPYGPVVSGALSQAGLSAQEVSEYFHTHGSITDEHYSALEKAGFTRDIVDVYLAGIQVKKTEDANVAEADIREIKSMVGGEAEYQKMVQWAAKNLTQEQLDSFNAAVSTGKKDTAMWAVQGLYGMFTGKTGSNPKFVRGRPGDDGPVGFASKHELVSAMRDPRYGKDTAYTQEVETRVARSSIFQRRG